MQGADSLRDLIREVPDFPRPGISFKDVTPLVGSPAGLQSAVAAMAAAAADTRPDLVIGIESRGFIFGVPLALALGCGFVPVRKPGKLPAAVLRETYALEYGSDSVEIHADAVGPGQRLLLVDDLLATGGTMAAAASLATRLGGQVAGICFLIELTFLGGRDRLRPYRVDSVIQY
jgi:adenine phosphoribosyltransferase